MLTFSFPRIMGIVNVTPDSFSDGGRFFSQQRAVEHAFQLISQGADMLDIGGESTRPGAEEVSAAEEIRRVVPVIGEIRRHDKTIPISIDTTKYEVAREAVGAGATMINDISGLRSGTGLAELAAENNLPLVLMHMQGTPRTMQQNPHYDDVVGEVYAFLKTQMELAASLGVAQVIGDVGIGFGKTPGHNWELLREHARFTTLGVPMLLGISRKSFLGRLLGIEEAAERDAPTALLHALLLQSGASMIRVHDVGLHVQLRTLAKNLFEESL